MPRFVLLLACVAVVSAQVPPPAPPGASPAEQPQEEQMKPGRVEGAVILAAGDAPVRKAQVMIYSRENKASFSAKTDEEGKFVIESIPAGTYSFHVIHPRYVAVADSSSSRSASRQISIAEGQTVRGLIFKMIPGAVVTGRVVDEYGDPQPRVRVRLKRYVYRSGRRQLIPAGTDRTDDRGIYRIFNIHPGRYYLVADYEKDQWERAASQPKQEETTYPPIYYPGVLDVEAAMPLDLRGGEERQGMDLRLIVTGAVRVAGRVLRGGRSAGGAMLALRPKGTSPYLQVPRQLADRRTGEFAFSSVQPGPYIISALNFTDEDNRLFGRADIEVGSTDIEDLVISLAPGLTISGRVIVEGESTGADLGGERPIRVALSPDSPFMGSSGVTTVKPDGSFELSNLAPGRYRARLSRLPEGGYVRRAQFDSQDVTGVLFEVPPGSQGPLTFRVRLAAATIQGVAEDDKGQPAPDTSILIVPEKTKWDDHDRFHLETTDQYGRFTAKNIIPGEYRVYAFTTIEYGREYDPDFLTTLTDEGEKVEATEKGSYNVKLKVLDVEAKQ